MNGRDVTTRTGLKVSKRSEPASRRPASSTLRAADTQTPGPRRPVSTGPRRNSSRVRFASKPKGTASSKGAPDQNAPPPSPKPEPMRPSDALNTEFIYYNSALKLLVPGLSSPADRKLIAPWLEKLYSPLYNSPSLRDKRNRFLHSLLITVLNDEAFGWFKQPPPRSALPDAADMPVYSPPACAWQADPSWEAIVAGLPASLRRSGCACSGSCPEVHNRATEQLDEEFRFLLHLIRPYVDLYPGQEDREKASQWIQLLCCITRESCVMMKGIRNDYMAALLGYATNLQLEGPFAIFPNFDEKLPSLDEATKDLEEKPNYLDPTGAEAEDFLAGLPVPEEGAFCYIALTGDIISTDFV